MCGVVTAVSVAAVATVASIAQQRKAQKATERQYAAEQRKANAQNIRSIREQIRATRLAQGQMLNVGAQTGGMGGSGLAGGLGSLGSQQAGNINYMQDIAKENTAIAGAGLDAAKAQSNAAIWGQVGSTALTTAGLIKKNG
jgi:hypothetical protein